jgi:hypothetical protein
MHALDVPEHQICYADPDHGIPWSVFFSHEIKGGGVIGECSGVLNPELLTKRYGPEAGKLWAKSRLRDRVDAVIIHELAEAEAGTHEAAEALAATMKRLVSESTRRILRAMERKSALPERSP